MDIQVRQHLAGRFTPEDNAERRRFLQLRTVLKALEQGANVLFHETVFKPKTVNLFPDKTLQTTALNCPT